MRPALRGLTCTVLLALACVRPATAQDPPFTLQAPELVQGMRGDTVVFAAHALPSTAETEVFLDVHGLPPGATWRLVTETSMEVMWVPKHGQIGDFVVEFVATDEQGFRDEALTTIRIGGLTKLKIGTAPSTTLLDQPGDFQYRPQDDTFTLGPDSGNGIQGLVEDQGGNRWELGFVGPDGAPLAPGLYSGAGEYPNPGAGRPGLVIGHPNCGDFEGAFRIQQLERLADPSRSLHVLFEEGCVGQGMSLFGELFYNLDPTLLLDVPPVQRVEIGQDVQFNVHAIADGYADIFLIDPPAGVGLLPWGNNTATILWDVLEGQHGEYRIRFVANANTESDTAETRVWIGPPNQPPVLSLEPLHTTVNVPIQIGCNFAYDPDGDDPITCYTDFGDGTNSDDLAGEHVYAQAGVYSILVRATDSKGASSEDTTHVFVNAPAPARAFVVGAPTVRLGSGKPEFCVYIEPLPGSFGISSVSSIGMYRAGPLANGIFVSSLIPGDRDHNGIEDVGGCFAKEDLRRLFADVQGRAKVAVILSGDFNTEFPNRWEALLELEVVAGKGALQARFSRDGGERLTFETKAAGFVRVGIYDLAGRRIRTVLDEPFGQAGAREVRLDAGKDLSPGVYFYRIETPREAQSGRFVILR